MPKYTAGPWYVSESDHKPHNLLIKPIPGQVIAELDDQGTDEETMANAKLMAAAPELLKALEDLVCCPTFTGSTLQADPESHKAWTLARAALRSAKGE